MRGEFRLNETIYAWVCDKGCGYTTYLNRFLKGKRVFCGNCGEKSTLKYLGETTLNQEPKLIHGFTLKK